MGKVVAAIVILIVLVGGGAILINKHNSSNKTSPTPTMTNMPMASPTVSTASPTPAAAATGTDTITIQNFAFSPAGATIKKGTTVTWTNKDSVAHTVTETDGADGPKSPTLDPGKSYSFTFNTAGTFHYHCSIHTNMTATVTVTE